jgi:hypothetical protein
MSKTYDAVDRDCLRVELEQYEREATLARARYLIAIAQTERARAGDDLEVYVMYRDAERDACEAHVRTQRDRDKAERRLHDSW